MKDVEERKQNYIKAITKLLEDLNLKWIERIYNFTYHYWRKQAKGSDQ